MITITFIGINFAIEAELEDFITCYKSPDLASTNNVSYDLTSVPVLLDGCPEDIVIMMLREIHRFLCKFDITKLRNEYNRVRHRNMLIEHKDTFIALINKIAANPELTVARMTFTMKDYREYDERCLMEFFCALLHKTKTGISRSYVVACIEKALPVQLKGVSRDVPVHLFGAYLMFVGTVFTKHVGLDVLDWIAQKNDDFGLTKVRSGKKLSDLYSIYFNHQ